LRGYSGVADEVDPGAHLQVVTVHGSGFAGAVDEELRVGSNRSLARMGIDKEIEM
jgi:hypothetical protein